MIFIYGWCRTICSWYDIDPDALKLIVEALRWYFGLSVRQLCVCVCRILESRVIKISKRYTILWCVWRCLRFLQFSIIISLEMRIHLPLLLAIYRDESWLFAWSVSKQDYAIIICEACKMPYMRRWYRFRYVPFRLVGLNRWKYAVTA